MPTLIEAREAAERGALQQARLMYETILQDEPRSEAAWLGLADVLSDPDDKRICYENVLKINKESREAREGLRSLEPQIDPLRAAFDIQSSGGDDPPDDDEYYDDDDEGEYEDEEDSDDTDSVSEEPTRAERRRTRVTKTIDEAEEQQGPPAAVLVAIGLALSVLVFAIGGGAAFFFIDSLNR